MISAPTASERVVLMLSVEDMVLADILLARQQTDEVVKYIMRRYAEKSVLNARGLMRYSITLSDIALEQTEFDRNRAQRSLETLMNFFGDPPSRTFFAAMVPVCMSVFPEGTPDGGSPKQREFFGKFAEMMKDPECFFWERDGNWAEAMGYKKYLERVENNG